ncbi:hypothetical protein SNEBB_009625 [Seison nebaliae]|nr:hypothetical protein SNEBB_009625 [Seison nebaliae]
MTSIYRQIVQSFKYNFRAAFAYGSAVFPTTPSKQQQHHPKKNDMIDFIFVVDDTKKFHEHNLNLHSTHYSSIPLRWSGSERITNVQRYYGAAVLYNTLVQMENGHLIKYGVIDTYDLIQDLIKWQYLYMAGRLHKPVQWIIPPSSGNSELSTALRINLQAAIDTSLLLLLDEEDVTIDKLLETIISLSYSGDVRMIIPGLGEDRHKIRKILQSNRLNIFKIYSNILANDKSLIWNTTDAKRLLLSNNKKETTDFILNATFTQDFDEENIYERLRRLPNYLLRTIWLRCHQYGISSRNGLAYRTKSLTHRGYRDMDEILILLSRDQQMSLILRDSIQQIVRSSSTGQTMKGIVTAGPWKSLNYLSRKLKKSIKSLIF